MSESAVRYLSDYQPSNFSIKTVTLTFTLHENKTRVINEMQIHCHDLNGENLLLDGEQVNLLSVAINGQALSVSDYQLSETHLTIPVSEKAFVLEVITEIDPANNTTLEGLYKSGDAYCTQCEAEGFRRISYYLDRPDIMAVFTTTIIADKAQYPYLLANGNNIDSGDLADGKHFVKWHDPFPKPCYLFALVAGDFDVLRDSFITASKKEVALEIFVDKGNLSKANHAMTSLKKSMLWDEEIFGLEYDLDIYMIVAVDFFNMGAMENKGLNVFNSKFVLADDNIATDTDYFNVEAVIAHEYFHNWTGNRVTCRDWFQLSLKEGLTVFRDQQFSADMHSAVVNRIKNVRLLRTMQFAEDAGPMAHPIRPEKVMEMNNFYTLTVYEKGAEVIRMIHTLLGADKFKQGLDLYFQRFDGMAVTCDDFVNAMADASSIDLTQFKRWYEQSGTPTLKVLESYNSEHQQYQLSIAQNNNGQSPLHIPIGIELLVDDKQNRQQHLLQLKQEQQSWIFENLPQKPVVAFLSDFTAPVKVEFEQSEHDLITIITQAKNEFCCWDATQKLLATTIENIVTEPSLSVPDQIINTFATILDSDSSPAFKAEQLTLPDFNELLENINNVDVNDLLNAIERVKYQIAYALSDKLFHYYQTNFVYQYSHDGEAIGKRALKNRCLSYLSMLENYQYMLGEQFTTANNMTDCLATLNYAATACTSKSILAEFNDMMKAFEDKWYDTPLVMDKWFSIQASANREDIFEKLDELIEHPLFSLKNPNRARSLIAAFSMNNPRYFHCNTGRGYQFLANIIDKLDNINPQIASRLITPLIQFSSLDHHRQQLIKRLLKQLSYKKGLSKDLQEKLDATLN